MTTRTVNDRPRRHSGDSNAETLILEGCERLLATRHLQDLSVGDIIEEAGVSRTTFYFYFSSKFAVVSALLATRIDEIFQGVRPWLESEGQASVVELGRTLRDTTRTWQQHGPLMRAVIENISSDADLREQWTSVIDRFISAFAAHIDKERKLGSYPPGMDSTLLAAGLVWSTERVLYVSTLGLEDQFDSPEDVATMLFLIWHGALAMGKAPSVPKTAKGAAPARQSRRKA